MIRTYNKGAWYNFDDVYNALQINIPREHPDLLCLLNLNIENVAVTGKDHDTLIIDKTALAFLAEICGKIPPKPGQSELL